MTFERLSEIIGYLVDNCKDDDVLDDLVDLIEVEMLRQITGGWILVEDKLPTIDDADSHGMVMTLDQLSCAGTADYDDVGKYDGEFTHWQPLPKLPQGDEE